MDVISDIDWVAVGRVAVGVVPLVVALVGLGRGPGALRSRLKHDIEMLDKLPEGTEARTKFEVYLSGQVDRLTKLETESERDWSGLIIAAVLVMGFLGIALWLITLDHWWWQIGGALLGIFGLAGLGTMFESAQRVPRDSKGKRI